MRFFRMSRNRQPSDPPPTRSPRRLAVNAFILVYVGTIFCWTLPVESRLSRFINGLTRPAVLALGVWQSWDLFAPDPRTMQVRMDATVTLRDGATRNWVFFQSEGLGPIARLRQERYRKWAHDNVRLDEKPELWAPTALFIARQFADERNPPVRVELHRHWADMLPPPKSGLPERRETDWQQYTFYRRDISAEDLR